MKYRIHEIEGSYYNSVSKSLFECVVHKEVIYESSFFIRKGIIKKAYLDGVNLKIYVSSGNLYPCCFICLFVFLIICIFLGFSI